ncbi:hypothetical protein LZ32DRAFT_125702 [Colletotrichum eremochloae]|nr:hypothetical protein LZ32DRAFT_125702 [Colletotrichum eremochloae]
MSPASYQILAAHCENFCCDGRLTWLLHQFLCYLVDVGSIPVAVALKSHIQRWSESMAGPHGSPVVLKFFVGAKLVGVEFPEKWVAYGVVMA